MRALGGMPAEIIRSPELLKLALPALRADFALLAGYEYAAEPPLACPFAVFGGLADVLVPEETLRAWRPYSASTVTFERFSGGHFYLTRWSSRILSEICAAFSR